MASGKERKCAIELSTGYALRLVVGAMARSRLVLACNDKFMRGALLEPRPPWWPGQTTTQAGEGPERRQQAEPVWSCKTSAF
jgi:hypothetical protein